MASKSVLQTKSNPLSYSRVPFQKYKDVTPKQKPYQYESAKFPKGYTFGTSKRKKVQSMLKKKGLQTNYSK